MKNSLLLCVLAAGCGDVLVVPDAPPTPPPAYLGVWQASTGDLWSSTYGTPTFMDFGPDGGGSLYSRFDSNVLGCGLQLLHREVSPGVLALDLGRADLYRYELTDENTLVVSDQAGNSLTMTRTTEVPAPAKCGESQIAQTVTDIRVNLHGFSGLAIQSPTSFWVSNEGYEIATINPSNGTVGTATTPASQYVHVQTFEGANFWAHCGCGGSQDVVRHAPDGTALETLDTEVIGVHISVRAAAADGTTLWLAGNARDGSGFKLLKFTASGATHTLTDSFTFAGLRSLAALDGKLWGLTSSGGTGTTLVRIDPTTKFAVGTYVLPTGTQWQALAGASGNLWLLGNEPDGDARLLRITPPQ